MQWDGLVYNASVVTMDNLTGYQVIPNAAFAWKDQHLTFVGKTADLPAAPDQLAKKVIPLSGELVTPGLIDCHTHLVYAGHRSNEFEQRLLGASYLDIAQQGGGILSTVRATRAADKNELLRQSIPRANALLQDGVTTLEIKSGYGLDFLNEKKLLTVAKEIGDLLNITVKTTFLGAHAMPPEFTNADDYISAVCEWLPQLHAEGLVDAVDAFCETIAFSPKQVRKVFSVARDLGLPVKLHADQLSDLQGAALVAEFNGLSADHIEYTDEIGVKAMAAAGTVATLLPAAFHFLRETKCPPIELLRQYGVPMAVSTDCNPGTAPLLSLRAAMALACIHFYLTPEEALYGATVAAAKALNLKDRGQLIKGMRADFVIWPYSHPAELSYWIVGHPPNAVFSGGACIYIN